MKPSRIGRTLVCRLSAGTVQLDRGPQRCAGNLQRPHQHRQHRPRPAARVAAPAVAHPLAEEHRDRAQGQRAALDLDGLADAGVGDELVRDAARCRRRHVALALGPLRGVLAHVVEEELERGPDFHRLVPPLLAVGTLLDPGRDPLPVEGGTTSVHLVEGEGPIRAGVPQQGLSAGRVAEVVTVGSDQVGGVGGVLQELDVAHLAPHALVHDAVGAARRGTRRPSSAGWGPTPPTPLR